MGALAVADREPDLARQVIDHARRSIVRAMASFAPDGGWAEGPGYWNYATEYNVFFLSAVESALGTDFGLQQMAGFRETGVFRMQSIGPLNRTFNYADAHDSPGATPQMFWFVKAWPFTGVVHLCRELCAEISAPRILAALFFLWQMPIRL